ncbi:hypothetical protein DV738_g5035, partial [Chaetothyriales sp. CBS 135597]
MRNLRTVELGEHQVTDGLPLAATAWDTSREPSAVICAFGPTPTQPEIQLKRKSNAEPGFTPIASWDAPCPLPDLDADQVLLLQYFADIETACLVLAGGDIVLVREDPGPDQEQIEIVGSVDVGISAAAWAPDEQLLALVTRTDSLVLMGKDFEPVSELVLSAEDLKVSKHVSVGWGKKETQFQGKRAKALRDPTVPETVDAGLPSSQEDGRVSLSWRGDGAYFAVNSIVPDHRRVIRVFDREGKLDSVSEPVNGLEAALSWRPYGNLIASTKRSTDKVEVVFFERNGLRHGEFDLRLSVDDMQTWASSICLAWNTDSSVLAVVYLDRVQLWIMGNYHYYLKQSIPLDSQPISPLSVRWHRDIPLRLTVSNAHRFLDLSLSFAISRGPVIPPQDYGVVAVIDGNILKLTPLRQAGVPPPMSFCEVEVDSAIVDCAVNSTGDQLAVLTASAIHIWNWPIKGSNAKRGRYTAPVRGPSKALPRHEHERYSQVLFQGSHQLFILGYRDGGSRLYSLAFADPSDPSELVEHDVDSVKHNIFADTASESVWAADSSSAQMVGDSAFTQPDVLQPSRGPFMPDTAIFRIADADEAIPNGYHKHEYHRISLNSQGLLEGDDRVLARDCSSFLLTDAHLIFTTTRHLLKFVHLTAPAAMSVPEDTPETDERVRSIERGAKIVTAIPSAYAVVLQMPRGNLETIYPRALVVSGIRKHLAQLDFRTAFLACRQHQVDLNILHDYNPDSFFSNIGKFIEQLEKPARIDEFLSKLKEEDVTQTLYRDTSQTIASKSAPPSTAEPKINRICSEFLTALSQPPQSTTYLTTLLTAHVCKRPPDLAAALSLVSTLHSQSPTQADTAVAYLCFLSDSNHLYTTALGLYDLDVTLLIAQHSQRDPREYMPFLQSLNSLPLLRRKYTIDNHLKRYTKALASLVALEAHDEAEAYTLKHTLYTDALDLYKYSPVHKQQLTRLYATHLASQSQNLHAAVLYESLGDYSSAQPLYALAHRWREALTCASLVPVSPSSLTALATQLATTQVEEHRDYRAASYIHEHYLHDPIHAAKLLCKGSYFAEALLLLSQHQQDPSSTSPADSLHTQAASIIDPILLDKSAELLSLLNDCTTQLASQLPRILELRRIKALDPLAFYGGDPSALGGAGGAGTDFDDAISLAPTMSTVTNQSMFTRYNAGSTQFGGTIASSSSSRKTSKTRRKEERKRARGKKGSVYEEEYLVASIGRLIDRVNGVHDEVTRLCFGLVRRAMRERARDVDDAMRATIARCQDAKAQNEVDAAASGAAANAPEVKVWKGDLFS